MTHVLSVTCRNSTLFLVDHEGEPWVPVGPIVKYFSLNLEMVCGWTKDISWLSARTLIIAGIESVTESLCVPLRKLCGWLMMLESRASVSASQSGVDDVLWSAWKQRHQMPSFPYSGRLLLHIEGGRIGLAQQVPDHWLVAPLEGFHEISAKAGYHVTHRSIHELLYAAKF